MHTQIEILTEGESSEHEFFIGARKISWAPEIDGEILINDSEVGKVEVGKRYMAYVQECVGDKLIATVTKALS